MKLGAEDIELIKVMDWCRFQKLDSFIWHCANERQTSPQSGSVLKRKGVKAGVADLTIMRASSGKHGAFIELKTATGKLSDSQKKFLDAMGAECYFTATCYSADSAIDTIKEYLQII